MKPHQSYECGRAAQAETLLAVGDAGLVAAPVPTVAPMPAAADAPPAVRVTVCPGYTCDRRYAVAEAPPLFSGLGIGRYLGDRKA